MVTRLPDRIRVLLDSLANRRQREADLDEELRFHMERETEKYIASGMDALEARRRAARLFGGTAQAREACRDTRGTAGIELLLREMRFAVRRLGRDWRFTAAAIVLLALGVGANTAVYQLFDALRLRTLPVQEPDQLAVVRLADRTGWLGRRSTGYPTLSNPLWEQFRDRQRAFDGVLAWSNADFAVEPANADSRARGLFISGDFFNVLGVPPAIGRVFTAADDRPGCGTPGAVLSHQFWQRRFGGDPAVVGRNIAIGARSVEVLGVAAAGFTGVEVGRAFDVAVPICSHAVLGSETGWIESGTMWWLTVMGRMAPGESLGVVNARLEAVSPGLFESTLPAGYPAEAATAYLGFRLAADPAATGISGLRDSYGDPLAILLVTTCLVLLIACANLASLILARASTRTREFAVRLAIGASRARLARELMLENVFLAVAGAIGGVLTAGMLGRYLLGLFGARGALDLPVDARLIAFVLTQTMVICIGLGLAPAWRASRAVATDAMRSGSRAHSDGWGSVRLRQWLVVGQVALSLLLLFGALLFGGTLRNLLAVDPGFSAEDVAIIRADFSQIGVTPENRIALKREILERIRIVPGVAAAAEVRHVPLGGTGTSADVRVEDADPATSIPIRVNGISGGFLAALGSELIAGRDLTVSDTESSPPVAIVNEELVRRLGLSGNPVGLRLVEPGDAGETDTRIEIVGVVPDSKYFSLREAPIPIAFVPISQIDDPRGYTDFVVRSTLALDATGPTLRDAVTSARPGISVTIQPFEETIRDTLLRERLMASLSVFFGSLSMLIAAVGLYSVLSHLVARRTKEIGVRVALGARDGDVLRVVLRQAVMLIGCGLAAGAVLAVAAGGVAESLVFGLQPRDVRVLAVACAMLGMVGLTASWLPARRAAKLEPVAALRAE